MTDRTVSSNIATHLQTPADMRGFLDRLRVERRLIRISHRVLPEPDVQSYCRAAAEIQRNATALEFDNIHGFPGKRLVLNLLGSWSNCALLLGLSSSAPLQDSIRELCRRADCNSHLRPTWVERAPCYECAESGEIDLFKLFPLFKMNESDAGIYLHRAYVVSEDSSTPIGSERMKIAAYSLQVLGRETLGLHVFATDNLNNHVAAAEKMNRRLPVAVCLGAPPMVSVAASAAIGYHVAQYDLISALSGHSLELARCPNTHLSVPANCEFVLEGYIDPRQDCCELKLTGERGGISDARNHRQITVTAISHRSNPILNNAYVGDGWTENDCVVGLCSALRIHRQKLEIVSEVARSGCRAQGAHLRLEYCNLHKEKWEQAAVTQQYPQDLQEYRRQIELSRRDGN